MSSQRACDVCHFYRQNTDGTSAVHRYGLSRQVPDYEHLRGNGRPTFKHQRGYGGIDLCDECVDRIGGPKRRPELLGRTGPKASAVRDGE